MIDRKTKILSARETYSLSRRSARGQSARSLSLSLSLWSFSRDLSQPVLYLHTSRRRGLGTDRDDRQVALELVFVQEEVPEFGDGA